MISLTILCRALAAATVGAAALMLAACASSGSATPAGPPMLPQLQRTSPITPNTIPQQLYVADDGDNAVYFFRNNTYKEVRFLSNEIDDPDDVAVDDVGNLYVANQTSGGVNGDVNEYGPNEGAPFFTYENTEGTEFIPLAVTVDGRGDLFVGYLNGVLAEYGQENNNPIGYCSLIGQVSGVAVDTSKDVFISYAGGKLAEFPGGIEKGCNAKLLGASVAAAGIALDATRNLLIAAGGQVDVIDPPYSSITGTIGSGFNNAVNVHLNKTHTLAFVTDEGNNTVTVVSYPSGTNVKVLSGSGIDQPSAAVDSPNAVY